MTSCLGRKLWSRRLSLFASRLVTSTDFQEPEPEAPRYRATVPWNAFNAICGAVFYRTTLCQSEVLRCHPDKGRSHALFCLAGNKWKRDVLIRADLHFRTVALATFLCRFAVLLLANLHLGTCDPSGGRGHCFSPAADALISKHHGVTWWHIAWQHASSCITWHIAWHGTTAWCVTCGFAARLKAPLTSAARPSDTKNSEEIRFPKSFNQKKDLWKNNDSKQIQEMQRMGGSLKSIEHLYDVCGRSMNKCVLSWELLAVRWLLGLVMATSWGSSTRFVGKNAGYFAAFCICFRQTKQHLPEAFSSSFCCILTYFDDVGLEWLDDC